MTSTLVLSTHEKRSLAARWTMSVPDGSTVRFDKPKRSIPQNDKMWAALTDISQAQPRGLQHTPEVWKVLMMKACGHQVQFLTGIDGEPFPVGFRSSKLNKEQMSELLEFILMWGAQEGVQFSDEVALTNVEKENG